MLDDGHKTFVLEVKRIKKMYFVRFRAQKIAVVSHAR